MSLVFDEPVPAVTKDLEGEFHHAGKNALAQVGEFSGGGEVAG